MDCMHSTHTQPNSQSPLRVIIQCTRPGRALAAMARQPGACRPRRQLGPAVIPDSRRTSARGAPGVSVFGDSGGDRCGVRGLQRRWAMGSSPATVVPSHQRSWPGHRALSPRPHVSVAHVPRPLLGHRTSGLRLISKPAFIACLTLVDAARTSQLEVPTPRIVTTTDGTKRAGSARCPASTHCGGARPEGRNARGRADGAAVIQPAGGRRCRWRHRCLFAHPSGSLLNT